MVGAASFKDSSSRCRQHECLNRFVVSASSLSGLLVDTSFGAVVADGLNDFVSGVPAPGPTMTSIGHRVVSGGAQTANSFAGESKGNIGLLEVLEFDFCKNRVVSAGVQTVHAIAGEDEGIFSALEVIESDCSKNRVGHSAVSIETAGESSETAAHATAGESKRILGLRVSGSSLCMPLNSSTPSGSVDAVACSRVSAVPSVCATASSSASALASLAVGAHARSTPMHVAHNSCSDTGGVKGPTWRSGTKGGVSGPAEDMRPVSEVEAV